MHPRFKNTLLRTLNDETIQRLKLQPVQFKAGYEIEFPGKPIRAFCVPSTGIGLPALRNQPRITRSMFKTLILERTRLAHNRKIKGPSANNWLVIHEGWHSNHLPSGLVSRQGNLKRDLEFSGILLPAASISCPVISPSSSELPTRNSAAAFNARVWLLIK